MKKILLLVLLILSICVGQCLAMELKDVKTSTDIAAFIYHATNDQISLATLLEGLDSQKTLKISDYSVAIPVREVFGIIATERFDELNRKVFEKNKQYNTREICSYKDAKKRVWRFTIIIFEENQYSVMKEFINKLMKDQKQQ